MLIIVKLLDKFDSYESHDPDKLQHDGEVEESP